jgi:predicted ATPase
MLAIDVAAHYAAARLDGPVISDRGVPDAIGYLRLCDLMVPRWAWAAAEACRYDRRVLVAPT